MNELLAKIRHPRRLIHTYTAVANENQTAISLGIIGFFLFSFLLAAMLFPEPIPTGDYLFWIFQNAHAWPATLWIPYNDHRLIVAKLILHFEVSFLHGSTGLSSR